MAAVGWNANSGTMQGPGSWISSGLFLPILIWLQTVLSVGKLLHFCVHV